MSKPVVVAILTFPRCQVLDVTGPAMVFEGGNDALDKTYYKVHILSAEGGPIKTSCAVTLETTPIASVSPASMTPCLSLVETSTDWSNSRQMIPGAFALAHFGLLDGKRVATHWSKCAELAERWPDVEVDRNALFVHE
eukprot:gene14391-17576_t